jgi:hypothetical protein
MQTYVIVRRNGWRTTTEFERAAERSHAANVALQGEVDWIRTYVLGERDGGVGTVCVYQASSPEAVRRHASEAGLPIDEIVKVVDTVIVHPVPVAAATGKP